MGLLQAIIDAIAGEDNSIAGGALTQSTALLSATATTLAVESTIGFGELSDGAGDALFVLDGEVIYAVGRTDTSFTGLSRAQQNTTAAPHSVPSVVVDIAGNSSALDLVRRALFSTTAIGPDLDVVGRNLGLHKCPGISDAQWRKEIQTVAYLAKQPMSAIETALEAFYAPSAFTVYERLATRPYTVFARIDVPGAHDLRGRFFLNSGEPHVVAAGAVVTNYPIHARPLGLGTLGVFRVVPDNARTRQGDRDVVPDYFAAGTFVGSTITLGAPPADGTKVLVDYNAFAAHYLPPNAAFQSEGDFPPYFADNLQAARCILDLVRAAGVGIDVAVRSFI